MGEKERGRGHIYIHRERERERERGRVLQANTNQLSGMVTSWQREAGRQTDRQTERQIERGGEELWSEYARGLICLSFLRDLNATTRNLSEISLDRFRR